MGRRECGHQHRRPAWAPGPHPCLARHSSRGGGRGAGGGSGRHPFLLKPRQAALSKPHLRRPCRLGGGELEVWGCGGEAPENFPKEKRAQMTGRDG